MTIYLNYEKDEKISNFRVAEAVVNLCDTCGLNVETIAKMILVQTEGKKEENK